MRKILRRARSRRNARALLLAQAIDDADLDVRHVVDVLDGIPGAWDRIDKALAQARARETMLLDDL